MRKRSQVLQVAIPAGPTVLPFYGNQIPNDNLVAICIATTGVGGEMATADIANVRLKRGNEDVVNLTSREIAALMEAYGPHRPSITTALIPSYLYIPLHLIDVPGCWDDDSIADVCAAPPGELTLELQCNDAIGGGTLALGFLTNPRATPKLQPRLTGEGMNIPVSAEQDYSGVNTPEGWVLKDIALPQTGLDNLRVIMPGFDPYDLQASGAVAAAGGNLAIAQSIMHGAVPGGTTDPHWHRMNLNLPFRSPLSRFRLKTDAALWGGATNRMARYLIGPRS